MNVNYEKKTKVRAILPQILFSGIGQPNGHPLHRLRRAVSGAALVENAGRLSHGIYNRPPAV